MQVCATQNFTQNQEELQISKQHRNSLHLLPHLQKKKKKNKNPQIREIINNAQIKTTTLNQTNHTST